MTEKNIITINIDLDELMKLLKKLGGDNQIVKSIVNALIFQKQNGSGDNH